MSNRYACILAAGGAAVLAAALAAAPALAATAWTIQPGGVVTAKSGKVAVKDSKTGSALTCVSSTAGGTLKRGSGLPGSHVGSLSAVSINICGGGLTFHLQAGGLPWHVNLSSYEAAKGVALGTLSHLHLTLSGNGCNAMIDGTSGTADDGWVRFRYTDSTGQLKVLTTGGNLHWNGVSSGCLGLINDGDPVTLSGTYTVSPKQAITSP